MKKMMLMGLCMVCFYLTGCGAANNKAYSTVQSVGDVIEARANEASEGDQAQETEKETLKNEVLYSDEEVDYDLTTMGADMTYALVYDMSTNPDNYVGKIVRANGIYFYYQDEETGTEYKTVIIKDAVACCAQGIEFKEADGQELPEPVSVVTPGETAEEIIVTGVLGYYYEGQYIYLELHDADVKA